MVRSIPFLTLSAVLLGLAPASLLSQIVLGTPGALEPERYVIREPLRDSLIIQGPVIIVAEHDLNPNGHDIQIDRQGSLTLFAKANVNMHSGVFRNPSRPQQLTIIGASQWGQRIDLMNWDQFSGTVYAPNGTIILSGKPGAAFNGSITAGNINLNTNRIRFHYDEALADLVLTSDGLGSQKRSFTVERYEALDRPDGMIDIDGQTVSIDELIDGFFAD